MAVGVAAGLREAWPGEACELGSGAGSACVTGFPATPASLGEGYGGTLAWQQR